MTPILENMLLTTLQPWCIAVGIIVLASGLRKNNQKRRDDFLTALGFIVFSAGAAYLHRFLLSFCPFTIDAQLLTLDRSLHFDTLAVFAFMRHVRWLWIALQFLYLCLPIVMAIAWVVEQNFVLRRAVVIGGIICWFFYATFPAAGPVYYLAGIANDAARNAMPSMHLSWALMLAINSHSRLKVPLWIYAACIAVATLALGEHYLVDLLAAIPYTLRKLDSKEDVLRDIADCIAEYERGESEEWEVPF